MNTTMDLDEIRKIYESISEQHQRTICLIVGLYLQEESEAEMITLINGLVPIHPR